MSVVSRYAYVNTRVSVLSERLLSSAELGRMLAGPLDQASALLAKADLREFEEDGDSGPLEQRLFGKLVQEGRVLRRGLTGNAREFIDYWLRRFALINMKTILRGKIAGWRPEVILRELIELGSVNASLIDSLVHTDDIADLLRNLETGPFSEMASRARRAYEEKRDLFATEAVLDREYFVGLAKRVALLSDYDRGYLQPVFGSFMDRINLVWLLRYRLGYHLAPPHAYFLLVPTGTALKSPELLSLVQLDNLSQVLHRLPNPLRALLKDAKSITEVEFTLDLENRRVAWRTLRNTSFNLARVFAYLFLREKQLLLFHVFLRGHRLQLGSELVVLAGGVIKPPSRSTA